MFYMLLEMKKFFEKSQQQILLLETIKRRFEGLSETIELVYFFNSSTGISDEEIDTGIRKCISAIMESFEIDQLLCNWHKSL